MILSRQTVSMKYSSILWRMTLLQRNIAFSPSSSTRTEELGSWMMSSLAPYQQTRPSVLSQRSKIAAFFEPRFFDCCHGIKPTACACIRKEVLANHAFVFSWNVTGSRVYFNWFWLIVFGIPLADFLHFHKQFGWSFPSIQAETSLESHIEHLLFSNGSGDSTDSIGT